MITEFQDGLVKLVMAGVLCVSGLCGCRMMPVSYLARNGVSDYRIVLAPDASPSEKWAAGELASNLFEMTGARLTVSSSNSASPSIFIGPGPDAKRLCPDVNWDALGDEGYIIRTVGKDLVLAGARKRGSMYAVFGLLEEHMDCHWFAPGVKQVPRRAALKLPAINEKVMPVFEYRNVHNFNVGDPEWMAHNRMNDHYGEHLPVAEKYGGKRYFYPFVHSFFEFVPAKTYFAEHPEYFAMTTGEQILAGKYYGYPLWYVRLSDCRIEARLGRAGGDNISVNDGPTLTAEAWHHVAVVFDRKGYMTRYVDGKVYGKPVDISRFAGVNMDTGNPFSIGAGAKGGGQFFSGLIDEVRIYKRALTAGEVAGAAAPEGRAPEGASAYWLFDEGATTPDSKEVWDGSGNGNTGTLHGCTWVPSAQDKAIRGGALQFDGRSNYVDCGSPSSGSLDMGTGDFTVMAHLKMTGGHRSSEAQLCLSNPDVLRIATSNVLNVCRSKHPNVVSVSQMDLAGGYCLCPKCSALDESEGTPAASIIRFVNAVAEGVEKEFPDIEIETLAYHYSLKAPKTLAPRSNVVVRVCSISCCFSHPLSQKCRESNADFVNTVKDWRRLTDRMYIWNYNIDFGHPFQMYPNFHVLGPNMRFFRDEQAKGVFEEAGGMGCVRMSTFHHIRAYVLAKLLWNPDYDVDKAVNDYLKTYYGPAWKPLRAYLDLFTTRLKAVNLHMGLGELPGSPYLSEADIQQAQQLFDQAQALVAKDPERLKHIRIERISLDWLCLWRASQAKAERTEFIATIQQRFAAAVKEFDPETIGEPGRTRLLEAVSQFAAKWPESGAKAGQ